MAFAHHAVLERQLGKVALRGQHLELVITMHLAQALNMPDEVATAVASRLGVTRTLDLIAAVNSDRTITRWIAATRKAIAMRNKAIHTPWFVDPGTETVGLVDPVTFEEEVRDPSELNETIGQLSACASLGARLIKP